jgi:hypothetical protein
VDSHFVLCRRSSDGSDVELEFYRDTSLGFGELASAQRVNASMCAYDKKQTDARGLMMLDLEMSHNSKYSKAGLFQFIAILVKQWYTVSGFCFDLLRFKKSPHPAPTRTPSCSRVITHFGISPESIRGDTMKGLTTTKVTYRDIDIAVFSDQFGGNRVFCCTSSLGRTAEGRKVVPHTRRGDCLRTTRHRHEVGDTSVDRRASL